MTELEKQEFIKFERKIQRQLDDWYKSKGWMPDRTVSCRHFDLTLNGTTVEEKIRQEIHSDILVEIIQDMVTNDPGWFYVSDAKLLHYVFAMDSNLEKLLCLNLPEFKKWLKNDWWHNHLSGSYKISTKGWGLTLNLVVPINYIPDGLIHIYDSFTNQLNPKLPF